MPKKWRRRLAAVNKLNIRYPVLLSSYFVVVVAGTGGFMYQSIEISKSTFYVHQRSDVLFLSKKYYGTGTHVCMHPTLFAVSFADFTFSTSRCLIMSIL